MLQFQSGFLLHADTMTIGVYRSVSTVEPGDEVSASLVLAVLKHPFNPRGPGKAVL